MSGHHTLEKEKLNFLDPKRALGERKLERVERNLKKDNLRENLRRVCEEACEQVLERERERGMENLKNIH